MLPKMPPMTDNEALDLLTLVHWVGIRPLKVRRRQWHVRFLHRNGII